MTNKKHDLNKTKTKLSAIFTIVVFLLAIGLEVFFFSFKYLNEQRNDKKIFLLSSADLIKQIDTDINFLSNFKKRMEGMLKAPHIKDKKGGRGQLFLNFIILDNTTNEAAFWNINKNFDLDILTETKLKYGYTLENSIMMRTVAFKNVYNGKSIIFFRELNYSADEFLKDLLQIIFITFLFSVVFYFIGRRFVSNNLKPVEENIDDMQNFIYNAGHELKTPIAVIHGNLQLLKEIKKYDKELTKESLVEINKLNKLIDGLVELSDINTNQKTEKIDLEENIKIIIKDYTNQAEEKSITVNLSSINSTIIRANRGYFYIFFSNLLGNAIKYNKENGTIHINIDKNIVQIKDSGIGIKETDIEKIYDRFFQGTDSRSNEGFGIGLSLVKKIAEIYKWKIAVASKQDIGTIFTIILK